MWGLGVSFGGSVGLMAFLVMKCVWDMLSKTKVAKRIEEINELSVAALTRRNELTQDQIAILERIACAIEDSVD